jgi:uncharacterized alkaline shock family protein YloU
MEQNGFADTGSLKISEDVLAAIAGNATREIKGVAELSLRPNSDGINLFHKKSIGKAIRLEIKDGDAVIDIYVNIFSGVKIPEMSEQIQSRVKETIQNMTGITVSKVNVHISGLVIAEAVQE